MESKKFLESLERMKKVLSEIESAKEQVEQTVNSYGALQSDLLGYTQALNSVDISLQNLLSVLNSQIENLTANYAVSINSMKSASDLLVAANKEALEKIFSDFKLKTADAIKDFNDKNDS